MAEKNPKKHRGKLFASIIVGGAIASILGLTLAPKKTKKRVAEKAREIFDKGKEVTDDMKELLERRKDS